MADDERDGQDDELREMLRRFLSGDGQIDPSRLAGAAGLPSDPTALAQLMQQLQGALAGGGDGINWSLATEQARTIARDGSVETTPATRASLEQALHVADLWLDEATGIARGQATPALYTRPQWVSRTMPLWSTLAEPVATSIADALAATLREQAPEEMTAMLGGADGIMRSIGGTLFALQLGQVVGALSAEVVSGGDIGIPLLDEGQAALVPQNVDAFGEGLDLARDQIALYLAVRELAHARLFRHARWLRQQVVSAVTEFSRGITIDTDRLAELAEGFDPSNPEELRDAMMSGSLIPPRTESQQAALTRLETMLALVEGWVDVVTADAAARLPRADAVAETVRRRRAAGGPAESAFSTLVGLELRPRRLREAAAMWRRVTDEAGAAARDGLWGHPDLQPTSEDIDDPARLIARLVDPASASDAEEDELDRALEDLLRDDGAPRPAEGADGAVTEPGTSASADASSDPVDDRRDDRGDDRAGEPDGDRGDDPDDDRGDGPDDEHGPDTGLGRPV